MNAHITSVIGMAAALFSVLVACGTQDASRDDYDADKLPVVVLAEELRLGSTDDPDAGFSIIGPVAVDADDNIYVLEQQDLEVRIFDSNGKPLRTIGRAGEGPGEFGRPESLGFKADTLWVSDPWLRRVTMFSQDGSVLTTFPTVRSVKFETSSSAVEAFARGGVVRRDGYVYMEQQAALVFLDGLVTPPESMAVPVVRFDRSGKMVDTVGYNQIYLIDSKDKGSPERPSQTDMLLDPGPPADTPLRVRLDDGLILVDRQSAASPAAASFTVTRLGAVDDTVYHRRFRYQPRTFRDAFLDSLKDARGALDLPSFQAPISAAKLGDDGTLWLRREADTEAAHRWIILAPDGTPRGQVDLSGTSAIRWIRGDIIYAVERDESDVPWLVRYRVNR